MTPDEYLTLHPDPPFDINAYAAAYSAACDEVSREMPGLPAMTVGIIAGDRLSSPKATAMVDAGVPWTDAIVFLGSYEKMRWLLTMDARGIVTDRQLLDVLPGWWPASDPDDTDPALFRLWQRAWVLNGRRTIIDGDALPPGRYLDIYRGQSETDRLGMAWSLSEEVAARFARGASVRVPGGIPNPVVWRGRIHRRMVLAYLTGRHESEVIIDPGSIRAVE